MLQSSKTFLAATDECSREDLISAARQAIRSIDPRHPSTYQNPGVQFALNVLKQAYGHRGHGLIWRGRPPWMTAEILNGLNTESLSRRSKASLLPPPGAHRWCAAGPVGESLANSLFVREFIESHIGSLVGEARSNYNYYEEAGHAAYPHTDEPEFGINMLIMLEHYCAQEPLSALWIFPSESRPICVELQPGDAVLFHARSTVHQRLPVKVDENVRIVSIGYSDNEH